MLDGIKKKFPRLYDYYQHLQRRKKIREIEKIKMFSFDHKMKMLGDMYKKKIGHDLDWTKLRTYTEKMQWEKVYDNNPIKVQLSDKFAVREWVSQRIGEQHLIPLLGVWSSFDQIDFQRLPDKFVLKTNHGSGTNYIVKDKSSLNMHRAKIMFDDWMAIDYGYNTGFELHYSDIKRKIVAEQYLETKYGELQDYKFICFDGKPYYCWVDMGRYSNHTRNVYDLEWNLQPWNQERYGIYKEPIPCPKNFDKMIEIAAILSEGFHHVRVDLYNVDGDIYFGEMTFTNGSGFDRIIPEEYDQMLGDLWTLPREE